MSMSSMKSSFSTLNRWLGKKNKDKNASPNGKLSKSNTNLASLSVSSININETSQLEYNRITPLPAATSNAPFEQTFRITVLLPKEQLYVTRMGARVPLSKLLELVCDNKLLDAEKYEFRNPVDPSQVYSCDLTIGAVGLSEIRLCHKSESYDTFNADEVIKLHRTTIIRDSLSSSSEFSSRNSKLTTKTPSPYSSSNSLNSMDSTGMNYIRTPVTPPAALPKHKSASTTLLSAPPRKKRAAPRPPSQTAIPEKSALVIATVMRDQTTQSINNKNINNNQDQNSKPPTALTRRDIYMSTPNLATPKLDCNGNTKLSNRNDNGNGVEHYEDDDDDAGMDDEVVAVRHMEAERNTRNTFAGSVQTLYVEDTTDATTIQQQLPEPSPRKRFIQLKKKVAPAPPPRGAGAADDTISIASATASLAPASETDIPLCDSPKPMKRELPLKVAAPAEHVPKTTEPGEFVGETETVTTVSPASPASAIPVAPAAPTAPAAVKPPTPTSNVPKPVPRQTTTTLLNSTETTMETTTTTIATIQAAKSTQPAAEATTKAQTSTSITTTGNNNDSSIINNNNTNNHTNNNVSKVMLNRTPTPEPRSLTSEPASLDSPALAEQDQDDNVSKQADSGIGEPVPSPLPDSLPSEGSAQEFKSTFESSSDDDDMVKVYNFKLGKTVVKLLANGQHPTLEELALLAGAEASSTEHTPVPTDMDDVVVGVVSSSTAQTPATANSAGTELTSWNFAIPISPPPNFADSAAPESPTIEMRQTLSQDVPITPKIKARPVLDFEALTESGRANKKPTLGTSVTQAATEQPKYIQKPGTPATTPLNDIVDELAAIIQENRMDELIRKSKSAEQCSEIEAAKPNTLTNFSIGAAGAKTLAAFSPTRMDSEPMGLAIATATPSVTPATPESPLSERESVYRRQQLPASQPQQPRRRSITRADSFQTAAKLSEALSGLVNRRSSSQLSLSKLDSNGLQLNRRRSSSELSIGESPTLQSPEVIKSILGSRKNSLVNMGHSDSSEYSCNNNNKNSSHSTSNTTTASAVCEPDSVTAAEMQLTEQVKPKKVIELHRNNNSSSNNSNDMPMSTTHSNSKDSSTRNMSSVSNGIQVTTLPPKPTKDIPKTYRYSGPPSINFSTWNERPKVQVAIKNEGDYIFGGKQPKRHASDSNSLSEAALAEPSEKFTIETAAPMLRMGIPRKEYKVPITVKPLRDVAVESQAHTTEATVANAKRQNTTTIEIGTAASNEPMLVVRRQQQQVPIGMVNASTLPRVNHTHRFTMPAASATHYRSTSITQLKAMTPKQSKTEDAYVTAPTAPTAATATAASLKSLASNNDAATATAASTATATAQAPFGQGTLRRTGFKEKMLAKEQQEQERAMRTSMPIANGGAAAMPAVAPKLGKTATMPATTAATTTPTVTTAKTIVKSAKLELKLQQPLHAPAAANTTTTTTLPPSFRAPGTLRPITVASTPPVPPPAPALPTLKPVGARSGSKANSPTTPQPGDTRAQLLDAIRNFKREELNRT